MFIAIRHVKCPSCGTKYKVEAKNVLILFVMITIGTLSVPYIKSILPNDYSWASYIFVLLIVLIVAPFNQRLEDANDDS